MHILMYKRLLYFQGPHGICELNHWPYCLGAFVYVDKGMSYKMEKISWFLVAIQECLFQNILKNFKMYHKSMDTVLYYLEYF